MVVYLTEPGSVMRKDGGKYLVEKSEELLAEVPSQKVEMVIVHRGVHLTMPVCEDLLENGISVCYVDYSGRLKGRLEPTLSCNIERHAIQFERYNDQSFCLSMAKKIIKGKLANSRTVLKRLNRYKQESRAEEIINAMDKFEDSINTAVDISQLNGYEGIFSKYYFEGLSLFISEQFRFKGRSKRPPKDPFNSLLSFGYTMLVNELYTAIVNKGLNPYIGFMHRLKNSHPALASDMIEEWRSLIVDSMVMKLLNNETFGTDCFMRSSNGGCYLKKEDNRRFISCFETKLAQKNGYVYEIKEAMSFRETMRHQVSSLVSAIEKRDASFYNSIFIR
jgi:CRISPR-associated protein Cas1